MLYDGRRDLIYTDLTCKAMRFCYMAHHGQFDKAGVPYVFHPFHVAEQMKEEYDVCAALLHDIVEDTSYTLDDLRAEGFPEEIVATVAALTRKPGQPYMDYIRLLSTNAMAVRVKLADLEHNSDESRLPSHDKEVNDRLMEKYAKARAFLLGEKDDC